MGPGGLCGSKSRQARDQGLPCSCGGRKEQGRVFAHRHGIVELVVHRLLVVIGSLTVACGGRMAGVKVRAHTCTHHAHMHTHAHAHVHAHVHMCMCMCMHSM